MTRSTMDTAGTVETVDLESGAATVRVTLLQTAPRLGAVEDNLAELHEQLRRVPATDLAIAPELATHGYHVAEISAASLPANDHRLVELGELGPATVIGFAELAGGHRYNSAAIVDRTGVRVQRKLFLPHYRSWTEAQQFRPGSRLEHHDLRGTRVAVLICNDLWQPVLPWLAAHSGAEVLIVIANSTYSQAAAPVQRAWDVLITHAALTLQSYVVFVNRSGSESGQRFWGGSRVVGPAGEVLVQLDEDAGAATVELDLAALRQLRRDWPLLANPRLCLITLEAARRASADEIST